MYAAAIGLLVRHPIVVIAPFAMSLAGVILQMLTPDRSSDPLAAGATLTGFLELLLDSFGLGVSLIIADTVWRRGHASFDTAWAEARRKAGDIFFAAIGVSFVTAIGQYAGQIFASWILSVALTLFAAYFLIYAIPAAAIGGIPGFATLQSSIDRVQRSYLPTFALFTVAVIVYFIAPQAAHALFTQVAPPIFFSSHAPDLIVMALLRAVAVGYISYVLSKQYGAISHS
jgi:hypothetical protein